MTNPAIERIRERISKATEGPWRVSDDSMYEVWNVPEDHLIAVSSPKEDFSFGKTTCYSNANFIAHARTDLPALLQALEIFMEACEVIAKSQGHSDKIVCLTTIDLNVATSVKALTRANSILNGLGEG